MIKKCPKCDNELYTGRHKDVLFFVYDSNGNNEEELYTTIYMEFCPVCNYSHIEEH